MAEKDSIFQRGQIRGYLFEMAILHLLLNNGFSRVSGNKTSKKDKNQVNRVRENRPFFVELRGRGGWHQIDCPCDYSILSPFMYPIRLIGEVKYYDRLVGKDTVRQFVGVLRDIQENYIVPVELEEEKKTRLPKLPCRYIEVGTIFAAKGFTRTAELLAYAQGIKTISYKNNLMVKSIKEVIDRLEKKIPYEIFKSNEVSILQYINDCFDSYDDKMKIGKTSRPDSFVTDSSLDGDGIDSDIIQLVEATKRIKSDFFATTYEGIVIHFLSDSVFPEHVFYGQDVKDCKIHYSRNANNRIDFWLTIDKADDVRFYFTPPGLLLESVNKSYESGLREKGIIFKELTFTREIDGKMRLLKLHINKKWLDNLKKGIREANQLD